MTNREDLPVVRRAVFSGRGFLASGVVVLFLLGLVMRVVPTFEGMFRDFGTKLPGATVGLLVFSRWCVNDGGWMVLACVPVGVGFLTPWVPGWRGRGEEGDRVARLEGLVRTLIAVVVAFVVIQFLALAAWVVLYLPMYGVMQSVSGGVGR